jgi:hypothetical protein
MDNKDKNSASGLLLNDDDPLIKKYNLMKKKRERYIADKDFVSEILEELTTENKEMKDIKFGVLVKTGNIAGSNTSTSAHSSKSELHHSESEEIENEPEEISEETGKHELL